MKDASREQIAAEVLELGEMLFDTLLEAAGQPSSEGEAVDVSLREEMQAAAEEYFTALRLLLKLELTTVFPDMAPMVTAQVRWGLAKRCQTQ